MHIKNLKTFGGKSHADWGPGPLAALVTPLSASARVCARSQSDLSFYAIVDGKVVNDDARGDLFDAVNTTAQCWSQDSSCTVEPISVSHARLP